MRAEASSAPHHELSMFASAVAGRPVSIVALPPGQPSWTDGQTIFVDDSGHRLPTVTSVAVQAALIAAGSLDPGVVGSMARRPAVAKRYLAVEGHRALSESAPLLPSAVRACADRGIASRSYSAAASLAIAAGRSSLEDPPAAFGVLDAKKIIAATRRTAECADRAAPGHVPRRSRRQELEELDDGEVDDSGDPDVFSSPVGGGGFLGKWLKKMLGSARRSDGTGGGSPGADAPTHRTNSANRGARAVSSTVPASVRDVDTAKTHGVTYPEWDVDHRTYRPDWCTVREVDPRVEPSAAIDLGDVFGTRRPLARLGVGLDRRRRQSQGDDIDIDAAVESRVEVRARSAPEEAVYVDTLRRRRDLSVLLLLDVSGSAAEAGTSGRTVHEQQRSAVAALTVALHDLGDRVALYAYSSQGRATVNLVPVKRFDEHLGAEVMRRLNSLEPGAYSRLGAAIRHGSAIVEDRGGTPRRLLVVLSDGLAYDHGYERAYGAADARRALTEARRRGTGCVCLTVGASTDPESLAKVFGTSAHAAIAGPDQLAEVVGPLFRAALNSVAVRRRVS